MAVPVWPSEVPFESEADGITESQTYTAPQVSEVEGGPPIMRPRPGPRSMEMPWRSVPLDGAQWQAFEQFARSTLRDGTLVFEMPIHKTGQGFVARKCEMKNGLYTTDKSLVPWVRISFTLIVWNF